MDLYLLKYNNYYNRQVKKFVDVSQYNRPEFMCQPYAIGDINPIEYDLNPNDGVMTEAVINWEGDNPDYVLIADGRVIKSRWFVIESTRQRNGQFRLSLYRDLLADYYDEVMDAPMFVEKGYVGIEDPAIYNMENGSYNQIKHSEYLLKDKTKTAWIVGYCVKGGDQDENIKYGGIPQVNYTVADIEDWKFYSLVDTTTKYISNSNLVYTMKCDVYSGYDDLKDLQKHVKVQFNTNRTINISLEGGNHYISGYGYWVKDYDITKLALYKANSEVERVALNQIGYASKPWGTPDDVRALKNQVIKTGTGANTKYYKIIPIVEGTVETKTVDADTNLFTSLKDLVNAGVVYNGDVRHYVNGIATSYDFEITYAKYNVKITLQEITTVEGFDDTLPKNRPLLNDAPYCMFAIPYGDEYTVITDNKTFNPSPFNSLCLASGIATSLGGVEGKSKIYDLQLLPYSPIPLLREAGPSIDLTTDSEAKTNLNYKIFSDSDTILFWATESTGTFNITYNQYISEDPIDFKVQQQTRMQRLCSPNYNGVFEFKIERNKGTNYINVDYTYKPHQPYIHLNPNFKGLYGKDFNDARGLVLGGDFSLPILEDSWTDYQIENKNYQNMFNRQIENMETTNSITREKEVWQSVAGAMSGGTSVGVGVGLINPMAGAISGIASGIISGIVGAKDRALNEQLRNEALDYTKDMFGYQVDNIKALPNSLTRISAYNANNKIFPFIETYRATEQEEKDFKNKLIYNGMTIGRIGTLREFYVQKPEEMINTYGYFKGQIIRLENIGDDSHIANAISQEINKGAYYL